MSELARVMLATVLICALLSGEAHAYTRQSEIAIGRRLAIEADCTSCHTEKGGKPFAGGAPIGTPFGTVYGKNITFDEQTGIGSWTKEDFWHALHDGTDDEGAHIYPAMPYNYFTRMPRWQVDAIYQYLRTVPKVHRKNRPNNLVWPYSWRWLLWVWNWIGFDKGVFHAVPHRSAAYSRGAYLVEGPGHCGACHTPTGLLGTPDRDRLLQGHTLQSWYAPSLVAADREGIAGWTRKEIVDFLKYGVNDRSEVFGSMRDVVQHSTSHMEDQDLNDIAIFLLAQKKVRVPSAAKPDKKVMRLGQAIYQAQCGACHSEDGGGQRMLFAKLEGDGVVQSRRPADVIHVILSGVDTLHTSRYPTAPAMPAFGWKLDNREIAAVSTYVRNAWGNSAPAVNASDVKALRSSVAADGG